MVHGRANRLESTWASIGIRINPAADRERRLRGLIQSVAETLPTSDARYQEWFSFAYRWAEFVAIQQVDEAVTPEPALSDMRQILDRVDSAFNTWVQKRYVGLHNQPAFPPAMLHHVPRSMARHREESPTGMEWPAIGLPDDFLPLIAPGRKAFIREDERIVAHGGISLEELVVPLVHVERRQP